MLSLRLARAFTGKDKILKIEGGYHGQYDEVVYPPDAAGLPKSTKGNCVFVPFNDEKALERTITQNRDRLAAMILEGVMAAGGYATARDGYLRFVREITAANNVLLVLDEVQTFRFDYGGMQHICDIKPDLTVLGKIIGGGTPVGACGGRGDIMQQISPETAKFRQSGTFNANPVTAAAGVASLEQLTSQEIGRINRFGQKLADGIRVVFSRLNIKGQVTGLGSVRHMHFGQVPVVDYKTSQETNKDLLLLLHLALQERGIYLPEGSHLAVSTTMTEKEIDTAVKAVDDAMTGLKPYIEQIWPELVGTVEGPPDIKLDCTSE
jgi:glutamate-1-semialdehyde 2,1-aminomutase